MSQSIKIYSFPLSGHAHRVRLFASLAGIANEVIHVDLAKGEHKQAPFLELNPAGQVPVIVDGEHTITDSNAILVYLARRYAPSFIPKDPAQEAQVQKFLTLAAGDLSFGAGAARLINVFNAPLNKEFAHAVAAKAFGVLESHLEGKEFLVGNNPTIADIAIYSYAAHAPEGDISLEPYPNLRRLLNNVENLKGFIPMQATPVGLAA